MDVNKELVLNVIIPRNNIDLSTREKIMDRLIAICKS